mmetsp:Transcript_6955/g.17031  ORF Transcript_6955/g.17031 Transcript_6955/m.17031 type:complete len:287 (-) Transcript_6955:266-1126(-)
MVVQHPTSHSFTLEEYPNHRHMALLHRCRQSRLSRLGVVNVGVCPFRQQLLHPPHLPVPRRVVQLQRCLGLPRRVRSVCVCTLSQLLVNVPDVAVLSDFTTGHVCLAKGHPPPSSDRRLGAAAVNPAICYRVHTPLLLMAGCTATLAPPCRPWSKRPQHLLADGPPLLANLTSRLRVIDASVLRPRNQDLPNAISSLRTRKVLFNSPQRRKHLSCQCRLAVIMSVWDQILQSVQLTFVPLTFLLTCDLALDQACAKVTTKLRRILDNTEASNQVAHMMCLVGSQPH